MIIRVGVFVRGGGLFVVAVVANAEVVLVTEVSLLLSVGGEKEDVGMIVVVEEFDEVPLLLLFEVVVEESIVVVVVVVLIFGVVVIVVVVVVVVTFIEIDFETDFVKTQFIDSGLFASENTTSGSASLNNFGVNPFLVLVHKLQIEGEN